MANKLSFAPAAWDLVGVRAGDDRAFLVVVSDGLDPVDLTGMTITSQARTTAPDPVVMLTALVTPDDLAGGSFYLSWDGDEVRSVLAGAASWSGVWDCQLDDAGTVTTIVAGKITCEMDVTRDDS